MEFDFYPSTVDQKKPLIYLWEVEDESGQVVYRYVGKANKGSKRPLKDYCNNVFKLLHGLPYRKHKPDDFRDSHRQLAEAVRLNQKMSLYLVENVPHNVSIFEVEAARNQQYCSAPYCELPAEMKAVADRSRIGVLSKAWARRAARLSNP